MLQNRYPSVNEDNRGVFEILTQTLVAAKREGVGVKMLESIYNLGSVHDIDPWDLDQASDLEVKNSNIKKAS